MMVHSRCRRRFLKNRKGYSGIIAAIFMVLIALFLYFNVFMFMLDRNTAFQDTVNQSIQLDANRNAEQVSILNPQTYPNPGQVEVSCTLSNNGPVSVQLVRIWVLDFRVRDDGSVFQTYGSDVSSIVLQPGAAAPFHDFVNVAGASSSDNVTFWFETARGNTVAVTPEAGLNTNMATISQVLGDFLPDYHSFQWAQVNASTGAIIGPWNNNTWNLPPYGSGVNMVFRLSVTYYGSTTIGIDSSTQLVLVPFTNGGGITQYWPRSVQINNYASGFVTSYSNSGGLMIMPLTGGNRFTMYFGIIGSDTLFSNGFSAYMMSLTIFGQPPSNYAQTFPLFAISHKYEFLLSSTSGNVGATVIGYGSGFNLNDSLTLIYDSTTVATGSTDSSGSFSMQFKVPSSVAGVHIVIAHTNTYVPNASFTVLPSINLNSTSGYVGSNVTISGNGFNASQPITVKFDATNVTNSSTTPTGSFPNATSTATLIVPLSAAPGNHNVTATDGFNTATAMYTVSAPGAASKLVYTAGASQTVGQGQVSSNITVQRQDSNGHIVNSGNITVTLSTNATSSGKFYSDAQGTYNVTTVTISDGNNSAIFYYKDTASGTPTLNAFSPGLINATTQFTISAPIGPGPDPNSNWHTVIQGNSGLAAYITTTNPNDVIYACEYVSSASYAPRDPTSSGLNFTLRGSFQQDNNFMKCWWAVASSNGSREIDFSSDFGSGGHAVCMVFAVSGANKTLPFDSALSYSPVSTPGSGSSSNVSISTQNQNDMIIGFVGISGQDFSTISAGSGYIIIDSVVTTSSYNPAGADEYLRLAASRTYYVGFSLSLSYTWLAIADAFAGPAS